MIHIVWIPCCFVSSTCTFICVLIGHEEITNESSPWRSRRDLDIYSWVEQHNTCGTRRIIKGLASSRSFQIPQLLWKYYTARALITRHIPLVSLLQVLPLCNCRDYKRKHFEVFKASAGCISLSFWPCFSFCFYFLLYRYRHKFSNQNRPMPMWPIIGRCADAYRNSTNFLHCGLCVNGWVL